MPRYLYIISSGATASKCPGSFRCRWPFRNYLNRWPWGPHPGWATLLATIHCPDIFQLFLWGGMASKCQHWKLPIFELMTLRGPSPTLLLDTIHCNAWPKYLPIISSEGMASKFSHWKLSISEPMTLRNPGGLGQAPPYSWTPSIAQITSGPDIFQLFLQAPWPRNVHIGSCTFLNPWPWGARAPPYSWTPCVAQIFPIPSGGMASRPCRLIWIQMSTMEAAHF